MKTLIFSFISILQCQDTFTTVYLVEVFRHGARTQLSHDDLPPFLDPTLQYGSLTQGGMKQHYLLGKAIKDKFQDFFQNMSPQDLTTYSSAVSRTIVSLQSQLMGIFGEGQGSEVENNNQNYYNPPWIQQKQITEQYSLPQKLQIYPLQNDDLNYMFSTGKCDEIKQQGDFHKKISKENEKTLKPVYDLLENEGFTVQKWFPENPEWNLDNANTVCDWIYSKQYAVKDFSVSDKLFKYCSKIQALDNYVRYQPKISQLISIHLLNQLLISKLNKLINEKQEEKFLLLSGHDDTVASFIQNFKQENYLCILDSFNDDIDLQTCFDHIRFTTNVLIEIVKNQKGELFVKLFYTNQQFSVKDQEMIPIEDFINILKENTLEDFETSCHPSKIKKISLLMYLLGSTSLVLILLLVTYLLVIKKKIKLTQKEEQLIQSLPAQLIQKLFIFRF